MVMSLAVRPNCLFEPVPIDTPCCASIPFILLSEVSVEVRDRGGQADLNFIFVSDQFFSNVEVTAASGKEWLCRGRGGNVLVGKRWGVREFPRVDYEL